MAEAPPPPPPDPPGWGAASGWGPPPPQAPPPAWGPPPTWGPPYGWLPAQPRTEVGSGRFRALSVGELLDSAFSLYRRNFLLIAAISAVVQVPYAILQFLLYQVFAYNSLQSQLQGASQSLQNAGGAPSSAQIQDVLGVIGTIALVTGILVLVSAFFVLPLAEAATTRAVSDRYLDRPASIASSYAAAFRRLAALIVQSLILTAGFIVAIAAALALTVAVSSVSGSLAAIVAVVLFVSIAVGGIYVYVRTSLAPPATVLESLTGWRGLARSWNLVGGLFWRILGIRLLIGIITVIVSGIVVALLTLAGAPLDANGRLLLQEAASAIANVFVSPITYIAVTLLYYDARIRKEAFDIEMLAQSL